MIDDDPTRHSDQCVTREEADRLAAMQDEFIRGAEMICVDGYIGNHPQYRTSARLWIEKAHANIAGMQNLLYYPLTGTGGRLESDPDRGLHPQCQGRGLPG